MKRGMRFPLQLGFVLLSAGMMPLCFPPLGWWPLALVAFLPLFLATTGTTARRAFYLGLLHGVLGFAGTLYWLLHIFGRGAAPLFGIMGLFTALFCLVHNFLSRQTRSAALHVLLAATLWTGIEFYRSELFFLCFPWITPGSALGPTFLSPILGVYGATFLIILASAGFMHRRTIPTALLLSLAIVCLGVFRPGVVEPETEGSITVSVVQSEDCVLESYVRLTRTVSEAQPDLIVWPEYALPYDVRKNAGEMAMLTNLCSEMGAMLVVGTKTVIGPGEREWYNTALILDERGVLGEYYKARPVHFFNDGIPGRTFTPLQTELGAFTTPICFDCDYSEVARKMVRLGAEFLAVPSFDNALWSANQHLQHAQLFRLRAAENARWIACAASSGVSQIIDPHGNAVISLPPMETGVLTHRISRSRHRTFFNRVGWLFPWLVLGGVTILLVYAGITLIRERTGKARA